MTGYQAAMGLSQLGRIDEIVEAKRRLATWYADALDGVAHLQLPVELEWARNVYWMYAVVLEDGFGPSRDEVARGLRAAGIDTRTFFCPMDLQPCLLEIPGFRAEPCPVADALWQTGMYLPSSTNLTRDDVGQIAAAIRGLAQ
jgi:perosamine synthetase